MMGLGSIQIDDVALTRSYNDETDQVNVLIHLSEDKHVELNEKEWEGLSKVVVSIYLLSTADPSPIHGY